MGKEQEEQIRQRVDIPKPLIPTLTTILMYKLLLSKVIDVERKRRNIVEHLVSFRFPGNTSPSLCVPGNWNWPSNKVPINSDSSGSEA